MSLQEPQATSDGNPHHIIQPAAPIAGATPTRFLILSSAMLTFIGAWPTAAVVLCDLASTAYYIGGVVESQIGKAAPWFILAVMLFSYAVRSVYIESCSMFVRGGVYRVVKEAMGQGMAKVSVSALMFDYVLTGPISAVSAGHYLVRLFNAFLHHLQVHATISERWGAVVVALAVVLYFYQINVRGIRESSDKALKIMWATTAMAAIMIVWCLATLAVHPETQKRPPLTPELGKKVDRDGKPKINEVTKTQEDPLGWVAAAPASEELRPGRIHWLSWIGALGIVIAFGHSILAMSGEETLAQVYREVEAPKLRNFRRAAFIVFGYSVALTGLISFFAVMIIPDEVRPEFQDNLISGLAMHVVGPRWARLALNTLVVGVGFLILAGAVNTSIVGANGVLNRVAEDGVLPRWFRKPQRTFGTTWRLLTLVVGLQVATILLSGGDVILLGEAYAFGVVWSLVFKTLSMLVLRFKEPERYRGYRVPLNVRLGRIDLPIGLALIFLVLLAAALANLLTKNVATVTGASFAAAFLIAFTVTDSYYKRKARQEANGERPGDEHLEEFKVHPAESLGPEILGLKRPNRKAVWVERPDEARMLETCLVETDSTSVDIVVVAAHASTAAGAYGDPEHTEAVVAAAQTPDLPDPPLGREDRKLMTVVLHKCEVAGKPARPVVILSEDPEAALLCGVRDVGAEELFIGLSDSDSPAERLDRLAARWREITDTPGSRLTIRLIAQQHEERRDLGGGSRIPRADGSDDRETARALAGVTAD
jgi:amino acid transporter